MATLGAARGGDGDSGHARVPRQAAGCLQRVRHIPHVATAVIGFSFFSDYILLLMMVPILPLYGTELGLSKTAIGFMFGVKPFAQMFANPIMGTVCDRVGTRAPMVAALVCLSAATMLFAFAETYALLVVARILQGMAVRALVMVRALGVTVTKNVVQVWLPLPMSLLAWRICRSYSLASTRTSAAHKLAEYDAHAAAVWCLCFANPCSRAPHRPRSVFPSV